LIVDDNSPDGTGSLADDYAARDPLIHVLHRSDKAGLGAAYIAGFSWGHSRGFDLLVEMDADGSHPPEVLPKLLCAAQEADVVIGSRYVPGGRVVNWPRHRLLLSRVGNLYTKAAIGLKVEDATAGYRVYRSSALMAIDYETVESQGYCFQIDMTRRAALRGLGIVEVPITFVERELGESKMSREIVFEALRRVTAWGIQHRLTRLRSVWRRRPAD
jgi:dolichol-phosphate mannosyltransferase